MKFYILQYTIAPAPWDHSPRNTIIIQHYDSRSMFERELKRLQKRYIGAYSLQEVHRTCIIKRFGYDLQYNENWPDHNRR